MRHLSLVLACAAVLVAAGCQPSEPATVEGRSDGTTLDGSAAGAPATADVPELLPPDAPVASGEAPGFDMKGFAGTFEGTLPCASCPGIDATLHLEPDGRYRLVEAYQGADAATMEMEGSWSGDGEGRIRLDPASKEEDDRLLAIESEQRLVLLGADGAPAASGLDYGLERRDP